MLMAARDGGRSLGAGNGAERDNMENKTKINLRKLWREWIRPLAVLLLVLFSVRSAVADWNDVPTGSMKPTILEGDRIFVNKLAYDLRVPFLGWRLASWADPQRGDVVTFDSPADGTRLVKRVVGLPGDVIQLIDNAVWVNDQPAAYQPLDPAIVNQIDARERPEHLFAAERITGSPHPVMVTPGSQSPSSFGPVTVPPGHYFMMGDNRDNSFDSRFFGFVRRDAVLGNATGVVLSFHNGISWNRFFRKMD
jgi:signal peptidase I